MRVEYMDAYKAEQFARMTAHLIAGKAIRERCSNTGTTTTRSVRRSGWSAEEIAAQLVGRHLTLFTVIDYLPGDF